MATIFAIFPVRAFASEINSGDDSGHNIITSVPRTVSYQGILKNSGGDPVVDSVYSVTFRILDGDAVIEWSEVLPCTTSSGYFTALFDNVNIPFDEDYWLELEVDGEILTPPQKITMVGYSARSDTSDYATAGGGWIDDGLNVRLEASYDKVGIGTPTPTNKLHVTGSESVPVLNVEQYGSHRAARFYSQNACALWVEHAGNHGLRVTDANGDGVYIQNAGVDGIHVDNASGWAGYFGGKGYFADSVGIGTLSPTALLDIAGTAKMNGFNMPPGASDGYVLTSDVSGNGTWQAVAGGGDSDWVISDTNMYSGVAGNVGIGTATPSERLEVSGNLKIGGKATIGTGHTNGGSGSTIAGGISNTTAGVNSFIGAGQSNSTNGDNCVIAGGRNNTVTIAYTSILGGDHNSVNGLYSTIGGGGSNVISHDAGAIAGGFSNEIRSPFSGIASGNDNLAGNLSSDSAAFVGGGQFNYAVNAHATISGGRNNIASGKTSTIGGGRNNISSAEATTIGGGHNNTASFAQAAVSGGAYNDAAGSYSVIGGGTQNTASQTGATVAGGFYNQASGVYSSIAGGGQGTVSGNSSFIGSGWDNTVDGEYSAIPTGYQCDLTSTADYSMAFGYNVYIDTSLRVAFFEGDSSGHFGINRDDNDGGILHPLHIGTSSSNGNGAHVTAGGVWTNGSSRSFKENGRRLDSTNLLDNISNLNIESWNFIDSDERHIGPYAEEFVAAFDVGTIRGTDGQRENQYLAASDVAGVALAGVKELIELVNELREENKELKSRIEELETRIK